MQLVSVSKNWLRQTSHQMPVLPLPTNAAVENRCRLLDRDFVAQCPNKLRSLPFPKQNAKRDLLANEDRRAAPPREVLKTSTTCPATLRRRGRLHEDRHK